MFWCVVFLATRWRCLFSTRVSSSSPQPWFFSSTFSRLMQASTCVLSAWIHRLTTPSNMQLALASVFRVASTRDEGQKLYPLQGIVQSIMDKSPSLLVEWVSFVEVGDLVAIFGKLGIEQDWIRLLTVISASSLCRCWPCFRILHELHHRATLSCIYYKFGRSAKSNSQWVCRPDSPALEWWYSKCFLAREVKLALD